MRETRPSSTPYDELWYKVVMITFASGAIFGAVASYLALRNNAKVKAKVDAVADAVSE